MQSEPSNGGRGRGVLRWAFFCRLGFSSGGCCCGLCSEVVGGDWVLWIFDVFEMMEKVSVSLCVM